MKILRQLLVLSALCVGLNVGAVKAWDGTYRVTQPDGTELTVKKVGDERLHFVLTIDNKLLVRDAAGYYCYAHADMEQACLVSTGIHALDPHQRSASQAVFARSYEDLDLEAYATARADKAKMRVLQSVPVRTKAATAKSTTQSTQPQYGLGRFTTDFPNIGKIKGLIILAEYSDLRFNESYETSASDYFTKMLTQEGFSDYSATGSAYDYFTDMSFGLFEPEFTVVGPVTLSKTRASYGANTSTGDDKDAEGMVAEACALVDDVVDFTQFDNDKDGLLDFVFVIYAGEGEASSDVEDSVWPHAYDIRYGGYTLSLDGITVGPYACTNEWQDYNNQPDGIGTFVHEFSHVLGLPDLYNTGGGSSNYTPGIYDVMDTGSYNNNSRTPPAYSIFERNALGWMQPELLPETGTSVELDYVAESNHGFMATTEETSEFFLFENRQLKGWDSYIPAAGMLIWHIDADQNVIDGNRPNNSSSHCYIDIVEACNSTGSSVATKRGYVWPGTKNKTEFTADTQPAFQSWDGVAVERPITNIRHENGTVYFDVNGGFALDTPVICDDIDSDADGFTAAWYPVDDAIDYRLTVYGVNSVGSETEVVADMGSSAGAVTLPEGWTSTTTSTYATSGNYGAAVPSLRLAESASVTSASYSGDISKLSFWCRGQGVNEVTSTLAVEVLQADSVSWKKIDEFVPERTAATYTYDTQLPEKSRAVRLLFTKAVGNLAVDDITLCYQEEVTEIHPDFQDYETAGNTAVYVPRMAEYTRYKFRVVATDGEYFSQPSEWRYVDLTTGVEDIGVADTCPLQVAVNGRYITVYTGAELVDVYDASGRRVTTERPTNGSIGFDLPAAGFYIVRAGGEAAKVLTH